MGIGEQEIVRKNHLFEVESPTAFLVKGGIYSSRCTRDDLYPCLLSKDIRSFDRFLGFDRRSIWVLTNKTVAGARFMRRAGNRKAAELSGIKNRQDRVPGFVNMKSWQL